MKGREERGKHPILALKNHYISIWMRYRKQQRSQKRDNEGRKRRIVLQKPRQKRVSRRKEEEKMPNAAENSSERRAERDVIGFGNTKISDDLDESSFCVARTEARP